MKTGFNLNVLDSALHLMALILKDGDFRDIDSCKKLQEQLHDLGNTANKRLTIRGKERVLVGPYKYVSFPTAS